MTAAVVLNADPPQPVFATYFGGGGNEVVGSVASDRPGNIYITGRTDSPDFPVKNAIQSKSRAFSQIFIAKFSPDGQLIYSTYFGGSDNDSGVAIAVDSLGNAYVTGNVHSKDFPTTKAFQSKSAGNVDAFVLKLDPTGNVVYATYLGGAQNDLGTAIASDADGNAYIAGRTDSPDFPVTQGAFQTKIGRTTPDAFVTKLDPSGALVYSTFLGGNGNDVAWGIAVDAFGQGHVTGETNALDFPVTAMAFQPMAGRLIGIGAITTNAFLTKLSADGSSLVYSTYLGGPNSDTARAITLDLAGNAYITGITSDARLPILAGQQPYLGGDVYFASSDQGATFSSIHSGLSAAQVNCIAFDPNTPSRIYAGTAQGVFRSDDDGGSWYASGLDPYQIVSLAVDPANPGTLYAGTGFGGGIFHSTDSAATWSGINNGYPGDSKAAIFSQLAVDPVGSGTVYAFAGNGGMGAGFDQPLYRITNNGHTWTLIGRGLPTTPLALAVSPADSTLYVATTPFFFPSFFTGGGANYPGSVYMRNGETWIESSIHDQISSLAVSGGTLYAGGQSSFFVSSDNGKTWTSSPLPAGGSIAHLALDARNPGTIYALQQSTSSSQLIRSDDGGATWKVLPQPGLTTIAVDPANSSLHAGAAASADEYIAEFDTNGLLTYSTFLGGPKAERGDGIATDSEGNVYVVGFRADGIAPPAGNFALSYGGVSYLTLAGASGFELPVGRSTTSTVLEMPTRGVAVGPDGSVIAVMVATVGDLPLANAAQPYLNGLSDIYLVRYPPVASH